MTASPPTWAVLLFVVCAATTAEAAPDHVLCRDARLTSVNGVSAFRPYTRLRLRDRLVPTGRVVDVRKPATVCLPAGADGAALDPLAPPLTGYRTQATRLKPAQARFVGTTLDVLAPWGAEELRVSAPDDLLVPARAAIDPGDAGPAPGLDELACYDVKPRRKPAARVVELTGQGVPAAVAVTRPVRLCVPSDFAGAHPGAPDDTHAWLCLAARLPRGVSARSDGARGTTRILRDRFGRSAFELGAVSELCVSASIDAPLQAPTATPVASATPTPQATLSSTAHPTPRPTPNGPPVVSIRVDPESVVRMPGESTVFTAIGTLSDGTERDLTEDVTWTCHGTCDAPNTAGDRGRVYAASFTPPYPWVGYVCAVDPLTGTEGCALFELNPDPPPVLVHPGYTIVRQYTFDWFTALILDDNGVYRNATQDVVWSSSDPSIAAATNTPGERSRIDGVGPGVAQIFATDPVSGAVSNPVGFQVFGPLLGIDVRTRGRSIRRNTETIDVGEGIYLVPWAIFDWGFSFEGFEPVTFTLSDPTVATIEPLPRPTPLGHPTGRRGYLLRGLVPGEARISARDDLTGVSSRDLGCDVRLTVRAPMDALRLQPAARDTGLDEVVKLTALGASGNGTTRNLTQRVVYTSSDPSVVVATNEPGDRSKLLTVGPGTAVISAVDPDTGFATEAAGGNATITVRNERVDRIDVVGSHTHVPLGTAPRFDAIGHYPSGVHANVNESVVWSTSVPAVATFAVDAVPRNRPTLLTEGTTVVSATLPSAGISSTAGGTNPTLTIEPVVSLKVLPAAATVTVDDELKVHVVVGLASGATVEIGSDARFGYGYVGMRSSDAAIVRSADACEPSDWLDVSSEIVGRAPGVATVSASWSYDPPLTSTATGGDATITVAP